MNWEVVNIVKKKGIVKDPHFIVVGNRIEFNKVCSDYIKAKGYTHCTLMKIDDSYKFVFGLDGNILLNVMKSNNNDVCIYSKALYELLIPLCVNTVCMFVTIKGDEFIF